VSFRRFCLKAIWSASELGWDIITLDPMVCQREITLGTNAKKANYVLAVNGNQPSLLKAILGGFQKLDADPESMTHFTSGSTERHHSRMEAHKPCGLPGLGQEPPKVVGLSQVVGQVDGETK